MAKREPEKKHLSAAGNRARKVQRLVVLPFKRSVSISFQNIRARFFRSIITTLSLVLAVSFFNFVHVGNDMANGLLATGNSEYRQQLIDAGWDLGPHDTRAESSPKQRWIIILSLMVCVVGIVNAQLMAVTERFREIGTMKCLGALDRFILRLFVLEAGMQGVTGALAGSLIGTIFALANNFIRFGSAAIIHLSWADLAFTFFLSIMVGIGLSLVGAIYPAMAASRMQPVDAMRVEQ